MRFQEVVQRFRDRPFFETRDLLVFFETSKDKVRVSLSRWVESGKIIKLRRKKYLLSSEYRRNEATSGYLSNYLYRPSYVSLQKALGHYGMIPEAVSVVQAVTPKQTASWETEVGVFKYRSIKQERFWGYRETKRQKRPDPQEPYLIARPEKALLDLFYLNEGSWPPERLREMRFQNTDRLNFDQLQEDAERFGSPKVTEAVENLRNLNRKEELP